MFLSYDTRIVMRTQFIDCMLLLHLIYFVDVLCLIPFPNLLWCQSIDLQNKILFIINCLVINFARTLKYPQSFLILAIK